MNRQAGHTTVWILVAISYLLALALSTMLAVPKEPPPPSMWWVWAISLAVLAWGLVLEWRHDAYLVYTTGMGLAGLAALVFLSVYFIAAAEGTARPALLTAGLGMIAVAVFFGVNWARMQYGKDPLPDILRQNFRPRAIYEMDGVQMAGLIAPAIVEPGGIAYFKLMLQNCFAVERTARLEMKGPKGVAFAKCHEVVMPPAAVGVVTIPLAVAYDKRGSCQFVFSLKAWGEPGARVRNRRAREVKGRLPWWARLLFVLAGVYHGGGLQFFLHVKGKRTAGAEPPTIPAPIWQVTWQPDPMVLKAAAEKLT